MDHSSLGDQASVLAFVRDCITQGRVFWTYHVNMRMKKRFLSRNLIIQAIGTYEIIESYPVDRTLPSYLLRGHFDDMVFHVVVAVDYAESNVRIVTAYQPDPARWSSDFRERRFT